MPHNEFHPATTHMETRSSKYSLAGENNPIGETMDIQEGTPEFNRGVNTGTINSSPFNIGGDTTILQGPEDGDHLVYLLNEDIESSRLNASSPAQSPQWLGPGPLGDLDMEGLDASAEGIPTIFTNGLGQNDGLQVNGVDLHIALLDGTYSYTHGAGTPWATTETIGDTIPPGDITPDSVTSDTEPGWQYFNDCPNTAFNG